MVRTDLPMEILYRLLRMEKVAMFLTACDIAEENNYRKVHFETLNGDVGVVVVVVLQRKLE